MEMMLIRSRINRQSQIKNNLLNRISIIVSFGCLEVDGFFNGIGRHGVNFYKAGWF